MRENLISVIIPCYNQAQYLDECLQSVYDQTYQNWECIIVNDGSPDNMDEIALKWNKIDSRFKYLKKENGGLSSARNAGIDIALGEWILPLDADDKIGIEYLNLASNKFDKGYKIIYCEAYCFGHQTGKWDLPNYSKELLAERNIIFCSAFYKKEDWIKIGGYDTSLIYGLEDWDFWISLLKNQSDSMVHKLNFIGFFYRIKEKSMITELTNKRKLQMHKIIYKKHFDFFFDHLGSYQNLIQQKKYLNSEYKKFKKLYNYKLFRLLLKLKIFKI